MNIIKQCFVNQYFKPIPCEYQKVYCMANVVFKARFCFLKTPLNMQLRSSEQKFMYVELAQKDNKIITSLSLIVDLEFLSVEFTFCKQYKHF